MPRARWAVKIQIGGISFWQGPNDDLVALELMRDGTIKASWKSVGKRSEFGGKPGELIEVAGVLDLTSGTCETITINGKSVEVGLKFNTEGRRITNALWQITGNAADAAHAALVDDLALEAAK